MTVALISLSTEIPRFCQECGATVGDSDQRAMVRAGFASHYLCTCGMRLVYCDASTLEAAAECLGLQLDDKGAIVPYQS